MSENPDPVNSDQQPIATVPAIPKNNGAALTIIGVVSIIIAIIGVLRGIAYGLSIFFGGDGSSDLVSALLIFSFVTFVSSLVLFARERSGLYIHLVAQGGHIIYLVYEISVTPNYDHMPQITPIIVLTAVVVLYLLVLLPSVRRGLKE